MPKNFDRREEAAQFIYVDGKPEFLVKANGGLHWYRITEADQSDLEEVFSQKSA